MGFCVKILILSKEEQFEEAYEALLDIKNSREKIMKSFVMR
jgi:hypothetical protein